MTYTCTYILYEISLDNLNIGDNFSLIVLDLTWETILTAIDLTGDTLTMIDLVGETTLTAIDLLGVQLLL